MEQVCYLCGLPVTGKELSDDHIVPRVLISRKQPKAKGFGYAGKLPTHAECNNRFGPERFCSKAIRLIGVLIDENCVSMHQHKSDPSITVMAVNADCLKGFTAHDCRFFKFIDVREKDVKEFSLPSFFSGKPKTNPIRDAMFVALSVLTKSAAALLVRQHLRHVPSRWRVLAIPYVGTGELAEFDDLFSQTKPYDIGVRVWLQALDPGYWLAGYHARNVFVFLLFRFSDSADLWNHMIRTFDHAEPLVFEGTQLTQLVDYQWRCA